MDGFNPFFVSIVVSTLVVDRFLCRPGSAAPAPEHVKWGGTQLLCLCRLDYYLFLYFWSF